MGARNVRREPGVQARLMIASWGQERATALARKAESTAKSKVERFWWGDVLHYLDPPPPPKPKMPLDRLEDFLKRHGIQFERTLMEDELNRDVTGVVINPNQRLFDPNGTYPNTQVS